MALSVREQIMANWVTTLEGISIANGYNTDIGKVERFRLMSMDQAENVIIEVKQGTDRRDPDSPVGVEQRVLTIHTILKVRHDPESDGLSTDTVFNAIETDIHQAVMSSATRGGLARDTFFEFSDGVEPDEAGARGGKDVSYTVRYWHALGDMTNG